MGKQIQTIINTFNGGISEDRRVKNSSMFALTKHFESFRHKHKLVPHYAVEAFGDGDEEAKGVKKFTVAPSGASYAVWGLGKGVVDSDKIAVYYASGTGLTGGWVGPANNESTIDFSTLESPNILFEYKSKLYTWANDYLIQFSIAGTWDDTYYNASSVTTVAEPVHHPNDDIAYFFHDNFVHSLNVAAWSPKVLTLPSNLKITSACPYGNYLAIGCTTKDSISERSVIYLWDRDSSLATLSERIDMGEGAIAKIANLGGRLTAVMGFHLNDAYSTTKGGKIIIKQVAGDKGITVNEIEAQDNTGSIGDSIIYDEYIYILIKAKLNGDNREGIWAVDRNGNATLDFVLGTVTTYQYILKTGNVWWVSKDGDGSVDRTDTTTSPYYSASLASVYETLIFDGGDNTKTKKLIGVTIGTEALPANATVVLKYKKDENLNGATWVTILTHSGTNATRKSAINISGATLPQFKEIQFRAESKVGAVITELKFKSEEIEDDLY